MDWFWRWGGKCFGYRNGDSLFTHNGIEAGCFDEDEIYGRDGYYLGEVLNERLITNRGKKYRRKNSFTPRRCTSYVKYCDYVGYVMYTGYDDFPSPDEFAK